MSEKLLVAGAGGHHRRGAGPLLQHAGAPQVPQERARPRWRRACACSRPLALAHPGVQLRVTHNGRAGPRRAARRGPCASGSARSGASSAPGGCWTWIAQRTARRGLGPDRPAPALPRQPRRDRADRQRAPGARHPARPGLIEAYRPLLSRDRFPVAVLHLELPPQEVDVNVHPTKAWVRFRAPRLVQEMLYRAVQDALRQFQVVQTQRGLRTEGGSAVGAAGGGVAAGSFSIESGGPEMAPALPQSADSPSGADDRAPAGPSFALPRVPGRVRRRRPSARSSASSRTRSSSPRATTRCSSSTSTWPTSACCSSACCATWTRDRCASQELLFPQPMELGAGQAGLVQEWAPTLEGLGFGLEGLERLHRGAARGAGAAHGPGAAPAHRVAGGGRRPPAQGRAGAAAPPRALVRGLPRGHQGPRAAAARGDGAAHRRPRRHPDALLLPARPAHREPLSLRTSRELGRRGELGRTW